MIHPANSQVHRQPGLSAANPAERPLARSQSGRSVWPFSVARSQEMQSAQNFSRRDGRMEANGFVT
jgi:hypothetical protein